MWPSRLLPTPFRLRQEEILRQRDAPNAPRKRERNNDVEETIKDIAEEAALISIDAAPSDSHMVNMLYSFRAQADALGAMGVFDDDTTVLGRMLKEETGGHAKLMQCIDAHLSMERQNEKLNGPKPSMNESMRNDRLFPELRSYAAFRDDAQLQRFEEAYMQTELDMKDALKRVIEESWDLEDAYERIMKVKDRYTRLMQNAETNLVRDVVRAVDDRFREAPIPANAGRWSSVTNDPEYARIALEHKKDMTVKRTRLEYDSDESSSSMQTDAVPDAYSALPAPTSVTGTLFTPPKKTVEDRKKKMEDLKAVFGQSEVNVLQGEEFVDNRGGVCGYLGSFAKYAALWSANNRVQAGLTAIPIALAGAGAFGLVTVSAVGSIGTLVACETAKGIHERHKKGQPLMPPAIRRIQQALGIEAEVAKTTSGLVGIGAAGTLTHSLGSAASQEWKLLNAVSDYRQSPGDLPGWVASRLRWLPADSDSVITMAKKLREHQKTLIAYPGNNDARNYINGSKNELIKTYSEFVWGSVMPETENAVRDAVGWVWKWGKSLTTLIEPVVFIGSTLHKISNFYRDGFRPDRARLYLYCNDPEHDFNKQMLNDQQLAREVLPILYGRERGKGAFDRDNEQYTIKHWLKEFEEDKSSAKKCAKAWKSWYDGQTDWDAFSIDAILDAAKAVHQWKKPILDLKTVLQKKFSFSGPVLQGMYTLNGLWASWEATWESMRDQARNGGSERSTNWLAISKEDMEGVYSQSMSPIWYKLYKVLQYQHAYIIGGVDPSKPFRATDARFKARANSSNRPSFVVMIGDIETWATEAKRISDMKTRRALELDNVSGLDTSELEKLFDKYYPGLAKAAVKKQKDRKKEQAKERAQGQNAPPNPPAVVLTPNDIQNLIAGINRGNAGPQPDLGNDPMVEDADGNLPPLQADGPSPIAQSPVVDEVYARLRALRL